MEVGAIPIADVAAGDHVRLLVTSRASGAGPPAPPTELGNAVVFASRPVEGATPARVWLSLLVPVASAGAVAQAAQDQTLRLALVSG